MNPPKQSPAAYILGVDLNGLGVLRSLAAVDVPCVCIDTSKTALGMRSRFGRKVVFTSLSGPGFVDELINLARKESEKPVLFITQEATVQTVSEHRESICKYFRIRLPEHDTLMALMDKDRFHEMAVRHNAPLPKSRTLSRIEDLEQLEELQFPCILKPAYKDYTYGAKFKKGYVVQSAGEAGKLYREIAPTLADMVVQEWITGNDSDIYFCLQYRTNKDSALASFVGRKIRSWPPRVGGTASCTAATEHVTEIRQLTNEFFSAAGFVGMGGIEYKLDRPTGRILMIEPTVSRTDYQHEVATLNGVNLPYVQYCAETGNLLPRMGRKQRPVIWREPVLDQWSQQTDPQPTGDIASHRITDAYWRWNDPRPALSWELLTLRAKARIRTLLGMRG